MSTLSELTSQADFIASKNNTLKLHWRTYQKNLVQAVTHSNKNINHRFICNEGTGIRFTLFNHFAVDIHLDDDFYSKNIFYSLDISHGDEEQVFRNFAHATLNEEGYLDDAVNIQDKEAVLEHYLNKISAIYQCLFDSLSNNKSVYTELDKLLVHA